MSRPKTVVETAVPWLWRAPLFVGTAVSLFGAFLAYGFAFDSPRATAGSAGTTALGIAIVGSVSLGGLPSFVSWLLYKRRWLRTSVAVAVFACTPFWLGFMAEVGRGLLLLFRP